MAYRSASSSALQSDLSELGVNVHTIGLKQHSAPWEHDEITACGFSVHRICVLFLSTTNASLVTLNLDGSGLRLNSPCRILAAVTSRHEIKVLQAFIDEDASPQCLPRASVNLRKVTLGVISGGTGPAATTTGKHANTGSKRALDQ